MSIIFLFLFLILSYSTLSISSAEEDGTMLLKIKEQLGNPQVLSNWVEGFGFCDPDIVSDAILCTDDGRVSTLRFYSLYSPFKPFPPAICDLTKLETLVIVRVYIHGPIPTCIDKLVNLQYIDIRYTFLSSPVPEFRNHKNLTSIMITYSALYGPIPPSLAALPNLKVLDLSSNNINGTIPTELLHHPPSFLRLSNNWLSGELPSSSCSANFGLIHINNNQLRGDASCIFGKQKTVSSINLSTNQFEFDFSHIEIPENLTILVLSSNKIYGSVPKSLARHSTLLTLYLSYNNLCGEIPQSGNMSSYTSDSFMENVCANKQQQNLCGSPLEPCYSLTPELMAPYKNEYA